MSILKTIYLQHLNGANANMTLDSSGKVAIGSSTFGNQYLTVRTNAGETGINLTCESSGGRTYELITGGSGGDFSGGSFGVYDRTASAARMLINSSGYLTIPYQPAFLVGIGSNTDATISQGSYFPFNSVGFNIGNHFNTSTYRFTAPIAGRYFFSFNAYYTNSASFTAGQQSALLYNGSFPSIPSGDVIGLSSCIPNSLGGYLCHTTTCLLNLGVGDYVGVAARAGSGTRIYQGHTNFMGYLIG